MKNEKKTLFASSDRVEVLMKWEEEKRGEKCGKHIFRSAMQFMQEVLFMNK